MATTDLVALAVVGVAVLAVAGALVPALVELRRAARTLDRTLTDLGERLPSVLARTDALLDEAGRLVVDTRQRLDRVEHAAGVIRDPVARLAGAAAGLRQGVEVLFAGRRRAPHDDARLEPPQVPVRHRSRAAGRP